MFLKKLFQEPKLKTDARTLYESAVLQARTPTFYADHHVPDTVDGRFDMIILHVWLVLRHLKTASSGHQKEMQKLGQAIFDVMIRDFDRNVREIGISDVRVGKQMKAMGKAFYGRTAAYDEALAAGNLPEVLQRNLFGKTDLAPDVLEEKSHFLAEYVQKQANFIGSQSPEAILSGKIAFSDEFGAQSR
jgi:cytochrome b pre-mRNA-processing protein 3